MNSLLGRAAAWVVLASALAVFALKAIRLGLEKYFSIDEFQYAHAAWLVAQGQVPYRDFFEVHFPFVYQLLSVVYVAGDGRPERILAMRGIMLAVVALACAAAWRLSSRHGPALGLLGPIALLSQLPYVRFATEIRPDSLAFALFLAAIAALEPSRLSATVRAAGAGALFALACWSSQKAVAYGFIFAVAGCVDALVPRRSGSGFLLLRPRAFAAGALGVAAVIAIQLTVTGSWDDLFRWCFQWAAEHQQRYPKHSWLEEVRSALPSNGWIFPAGALGVATTLRRLVRERDRASADWLLLGAVPATFLSFALQRAPFGYSMLPFYGVVGVFAARGILDAIAAARRLRPVSARVLALAVGGIVVVAVLWRSAAHFDAMLAHDNRHQLWTLRRIGELTREDDAAYDNSGSAVSRPHAHFYFYTDDLVRRTQAETLAREVPQAIRDAGAVLLLRDARQAYLPASVRSFLDENYQLYTGDIGLWGKAFGGGPGTFWAIKDGRYFVSPPGAVESGALTIDGQRITSPVFDLERGAHDVRYEGTTAPVYILWLPRNGETYAPSPGAEPTFSRFL